MSRRKLTSFRTSHNSSLHLVCNDFIWGSIGYLAIHYNTNRVRNRECAASDISIVCLSFYMKCQFYMCCSNKEFVYILLFLTLKHVFPLCGNVTVVDNKSVLCRNTYIHTYIYLFIYTYINVNQIKVLCEVSA